MMQDKDEIKTRLNAVFQDVFDDESISISEDMTADDIDEWDSVSHISLVLAVEKEFGVSLNAAEIGGLANVGAMVSLLVIKATK